MKTVAGRVEDIRNNIASRLKEKTKGFEYFSVALDKPTDVTDTSHSLLFFVE